MIRMIMTKMVRYLYDDCDVIITIMGMGSTRNCIDIRITMTMSLIITVTVRIYTDGRVKYTTLLNYDVNCPMNFVFYPFDKQALLSFTSPCDNGK